MRSTTPACVASFFASRWRTCPNTSAREESMRSTTPACAASFFASSVCTCPSTSARDVSMRSAARACAASFFETRSRMCCSVFACAASLLFRIDRTSITSATPNPATVTSSVANPITTARSIIASPARSAPPKRIGVQLGQDRSRCASAADGFPVQLGRVPPAVVLMADPGRWNRNPGRGWPVPPGAEPSRAPCRCCR